MLLLNIYCKIKKENSAASNRGSCKFSFISKPQKLTPCVIFWAVVIINGAVCSSTYGTQWLTLEIDRSNTGTVQINVHECLLSEFVCSYLIYKTINRYQCKPGTSHRCFSLHVQFEQLAMKTIESNLMQKIIRFLSSWVERDFMNLLSCMAHSFDQNIHPWFWHLFNSFVLWHTPCTACQTAWHLSSSISLDLNIGNTKTPKWVRI